MMNVGRGRRRNRGAMRTPQTIRTIGNVLRLRHLTTQPEWALRKTNKMSPPALVNDVTYSRKVRFSYLTAPSSVNITPSNLSNQIFGTTPPFASVCVIAIEAWGPTTAELFISPTASSLQGTLTGFKDFSDIGVFGARPSHVRIELSPKDAPFNLTSSSTNLATVRLITTTTAPVGDVRLTVDVMCLFSGTADVERSSSKFLGQTEEFPPGSNQEEELTHSIGSVSLSA